MNQSVITVYPHLKEVKEGRDIPLDIFLRYIQQGRWQDQVLKIRTIQDKKERQDAKKALPYACMSGTFNHRSTSGLREHSGFICLDFDDIPEPEKFKENVSRSNYVYAAFVSCSGNGVAVLVKISPDKHAESFDPLREYFFTEFGAVAAADRSCRDVSRARYVSYDPYIYENPDAKKWTRVAKKAQEKPAPKVVFVQSDFDEIINEIVSRGVDICPTYYDWFRVGFAIASHFGERGRTYFEAISYNWTGGQASIDQINRQYNECLKDHAGPNKITIDTFYYYCKQHNISTISAKTKEIAQAASISRRGKRDKASAIKYLQGEGYEGPEVTDIVNQVYDKGVDVAEDTEIELLEAWLKQNYVIRRNAISRNIEIDGEAADDALFNDIWRNCARIFPKVTYDKVKRILTSRFPPDYNPFAEFFAKYADLPSEPDIITDYFSCIKSDTCEGHPEYGPEVYVPYFGRKWMIGAIANLHYDACNLLLTLAGEQDTGKTEFFRRMLPKELLPYYAQTKMDAGKDDLILMAKKMFLFDDETSGKNKKEEKFMKEILSKNIITVREPYGHASVDMRRIATFCGNTNEDDEVLHDPTGNRRIIPIRVLSIDFDRIDQIDRAQLWMEAYRAWRAGESWRLSSEDKEVLKFAGRGFESRSAEEEAILRCWRLPTGEDSAADIQSVMAVQIQAECMARFGNTITYNGVKRALRKLNWKADQKKINGQNQRRYSLIKLI